MRSAASMRIVQPTMTLRKTTQDLLARAAAFSGFPIEVTADNEISGPAALRLARGEAAQHTILWSPEKTGAPDYHVSLQCVMILRHFANPAEARRDLTGSVVGADAIRGLVVEMGRQGRLPDLDEHNVKLFAAHLHSGLGTQLRSMPIELRANAWLVEEYPELREAQEVAVRKQLIINAQSLEARKSIPSKIFRASIAMNSATALYWAGILGDDALVTPFRRAGYVMDGRSLLRTFHNIDEAATADQDLIDAWAQALKIGPWFQWVAYVPPERAGEGV